MPRYRSGGQTQAGTAMRFFMVIGAAHRLSVRFPRGQSSAEGRSETVDAQVSCSQE